VGAHPGGPVKSTAGERELGVTLGRLEAGLESVAAELTRRADRIEERLDRGSQEMAALSQRISRLERPSDRPPPDATGRQQAVTLADLGTAQAQAQASAARWGAVGRIAERALPPLVAVALGVAAARGCVPASAASGVAPAHSAGRP